MKSLIVTNKFNNKKLLSFLEYFFPDASISTFYKALRKKDIRVNDVRVSENVLVNEGDKIDLYILDKFLFASDFKLDIVYEDENILVVNKPKNIEVTGENSLEGLLQEKYNSHEIKPCHRLDRNTEGLVLFAKNEDALNILLEKFKNQEITKYYKCKVYGRFKKPHDVLLAYLFKDNKKSMVYISDKKGVGYREIITEYRVLEENAKENYSILEVILHTGRTHQIRAHLAYIGHPIIGDRKIWRQQN